MYLGINSFSHDASACLIDNQGKIIAAVEEERFTGNKKEWRFPIESIKYCLDIAGITIKDIQGIGIAWHPWYFFWQRILWSCFLKDPVSFKQIFRYIKRLYSILCLRRIIIKSFGPLSPKTKIYYFKHHEAHAASAFFASPYTESAFITIDGRGEHESVTWGYVKNNIFYQLGRNNTPQSLGYFYATISSFLGFTNIEKEGTVMALAALGEPKYINQFKNIITFDDTKIKIKIDSSYLDLSDPYNLPSKKIESLFGVPIRSRNEPIRKIHKDISASLQAVIQDIIIRIFQRVYEITNLDSVVYAGGVALNSVANGLLFDKTPFKKIYIQGASHDAGLALGCCYLMYYNKEKIRDRALDNLFLGPEFSDYELIKEFKNFPALRVEKPRSIIRKAAEEIALGKKIAWFQGRLEFGPRALGNRSILADPRNSKVQEELNTIKNRENFRPFAISILKPYAQKWLVRGSESPYMLLVDRINNEFVKLVPGARHVDGSVRIQTVSMSDNKIYYELLEEFHKITNIPLIINTSLNIKGAPIARTPKDAINVLLNIELDALVMGNFWVTKVQNKDIG